MHFRTNMVRFLMPKIEGQPTNGDSKWLRTTDRFWDRFFIDFGTVFGANLEPFRPPFSVQNGPGGFQDASKTLPRRSKTLPKTSRMAQDGSRRFPTCPRPLQTSILVPPGLDFDGFFDRMLIHVWMVLGSLLLCKFLADYMYLKLLRLFQK